MCTFIAATLPEQHKSMFGIFSTANEPNLQLAAAAAAVQHLSEFNY